MESITKTKRVKKKRQVIADNPAETKIDVSQFLIAIAVVDCSLFTFSNSTHRCCI